MKKYEVGFIINPRIEETLINETIEQLKAIYTNMNCTIVDEENVGLRELAYEIQKHKSGYYYFMIVEANHEANQEFERICRINENVMRFMVIDVDHVSYNTLDTLRK